MTVTVTIIAIIGGFKHTEIVSVLERLIAERGRLMVEC